jgi:putative flippase GtrA
MELAEHRPTAAPRHLRILDSAVTPADDGSLDTVDVEIVVPVYNEAAHLEHSIVTLRTFLDETFPFSALVTIVDNGSTDGTALVAEHLAASLPGVAARSLSRKGRGYALRTAWWDSTARVVAYMDVDLSTSLTALLPLVAPLLSGHGEVSIGTRLAHGARVVRGPKRELISRTYNLMLRVLLRSRISDAQCGFKALTRQAAHDILPLVDDNEWFFDTELLVTAERLGLRVSEVPVDWVDDPDSRVDVVSTAAADLRGMWRLAGRHARARVRRQRFPDQDTFVQATTDQLLSFAGVGLLSTLSYLFLFAATRPLLGPIGSNALALALCTLVNTSIHRALADRAVVHGPASARPRFAAAATGLFAISAGLTTAALIICGLTVGSSLTAELISVTLANGLAAFVRFAVLRAWVFRPADRRPAPPVAVAVAHD